MNPTPVNRTLAVWVCLFWAAPAVAEAPDFRIDDPRPQGRVVWQYDLPAGVYPSGFTALPDGSALLETQWEGASGTHLMTIEADGTIGPIYKLEAPCERIFAANDALFCSLRGHEGYTDDAGGVRGSWPGAITRIDQAGRVVWKEETPGFNPVCAVISNQFFCRLMPDDERAEVPFIKMRAYGADGMISEVDTPPEGYFTAGSEGAGYLWHSADGRDDFITFDLASGKVTDVKDLSVLRKSIDWSINEIGWVRRFADGGFIATLFVSYPPPLIYDVGDTFIAVAINPDGTRARDRVDIEQYQTDFCGGIVAGSQHLSARGRVTIFTDPNGRALWEYVGRAEKVTPLTDGGFMAVEEVFEPYDPNKFRKPKFKVLRIIPPDGVPLCPADWAP